MSIAYHYPGGKYERAVEKQVNLVLWVASEVVFWSHRLRVAPPSHIFTNYRDWLVWHITDCRDGVVIVGRRSVSGSSCPECHNIVVVVTGQESRRCLRTTVIHELLHLKHPTWSEQQVDKAVVRIMRTAPNLGRTDARDNRRKIDVE